MGMHPFFNKIPRYDKRADKVQYGINQRQVHEHVDPPVDKSDQQQQNSCLGAHESGADNTVENRRTPYRAVQAQQNKKAQQVGNTEEEIMHSVLSENMPDPRFHIAGQRFRHWQVNGVHIKKFIFNQYRDGSGGEGD